MFFKKKSEKNNNYLTKEDTKNNLYPYYKSYDLRFLIGVSTIYQSKLLNTPVIHFIDKSEIGEKFEDRLIFLFKIKERWRMEELILFMDGMGLNKKDLETKISRKTNSIEEQCIFNKEKKFPAYYLKNKKFK